MPVEIFSEFICGQEGHYFQRHWSFSFVLWNPQLQVIKMLVLLKSVRFHLNLPIDVWCYCDVILKGLTTATEHCWLTRLCFWTALKILKKMILLKNQFVLTRFMHFSALMLDKHNIDCSGSLALIALNYQVENNCLLFVLSTLMGKKWI